MKYVVTDEQFNWLLGFKGHIWHHYHGDQNKGRCDFGYWAQKLDELGISWFIQNTVAILMETRANGFSSLKVLLKNEGIDVL